MSFGLHLIFIVTRRLKKNVGIHPAEQSMCHYKNLSDNRFPHLVRETPDIHHAPVKPTNNQANAQFLTYRLVIFS